MKIGIVSMINKLLIIFFIIISLNIFISCKEKKEIFEEKRQNEISYNYFEGKNILKMRGKTVSEFLKYINRLKYKKQYEIWDVYLQGWQFYYDDSISVDFYFNDYKYLKNTKNHDPDIINKEPTWTVDNVMKETVQAVHIVKHVKNGGLIAGFGKTYY